MRGYRRVFIDLIRNNADNPRLGAEIGVWRGELSYELLQAFPSLTLVAVDPWDKRYGGYSPSYIEGLQEAKADFYHRTEAFKDRIIALELPSTKAFRQVVDDSLDFCFLDGNHLYKHVHEDIFYWFPKVRDGGVFAGHDYGGKNDWPRGPHGVKRAVDEWAAAENRVIHFAARSIWWCRK